jgi:hypothetical protein
MLHTLTLNNDFQFDHACHTIQEELLKASQGFLRTDKWVKGASIVQRFPNERDPIAPGTPIASWPRDETVSGQSPYGAIFLYQNYRGIVILRLRNGSFRNLPRVRQETVSWGFGLCHGFDETIYVVELSRGVVIL